MFFSLHNHVRNHTVPNSYKSTLALSHETHNSDAYIGILYVSINFTVMILDVQLLQRPN